MPYMGLMNEHILSALLTMLRQGDPDRCVTALLAPPGVRERLLTLYALNLEIARIPETVTEPLIGQMRLQWWRDVTAAILDGKPMGLDQPVVQACAAVLPVLSGAGAQIDALLTARERDLDPEPFATSDSVRAHARATTVPLLHLAAAAVGEALPEPVAEAAGEGYSLTGMLRALAWAPPGGRCVLDRETMARHGLSMDRLPSEAGRAAVQEVAATARQRVDEARARARSAAKALRPVFLPLVIASQALGRLPRVGFDAFDQRFVQPPRPLLKLWWATRTGKF